MTRQELLNSHQHIDWRDKQYILANILNTSREELITHPEKKVSFWQRIRYSHAIYRRHKHIPLAYILGTQPFYGMNLFVNKHTLIPRPETEQLVDIALKIIDEHNIKTVIDIGTGSGAIAVAIAKNTPQTEIVATDISESALKIARKNAASNNVKIKFLRGSLLSPLATIYYQLPSLLVANLPYLPTETYRQTEPQVKREPKQALIAGLDGLKYYRQLIKQLQTLNSLPICVFECDPMNASSLKEILESTFIGTDCKIVKDINNVDRFVVVK
jgi:release factor glutamine methyltransferase